MCHQLDDRFLLSHCILMGRHVSCSARHDVHLPQRMVRDNVAGGGDLVRFVEFSH